MLVEFEFEEPSQLTPSAMARLLTDLDGIFFFSVAAYHPPLLETLDKDNLFSFHYDRLIYLGSEFDNDDPKIGSSKYYSKVTLERASFESPPKFDISLKASLDCQQVVKAVLEFIKFLLTLKQHRMQMDIRSYIQRQAAIAKEIDNAERITGLLQEIDDVGRRSRLKEALVQRIEALTNDRDYPRLRSVKIKRFPKA